MRREALGNFDDLRELQRTLQSTPEPPGKELKTSSIVRSSLQALGFAPSRIDSSPGVVCDIGQRSENAPARGVIHCEMGSLHVQETAGGYRPPSISGWSHASGNDLNIAIMLGVASLSAASPPEYPPARLIFQSSGADPDGNGGVVPLVQDLDWALALRCDPQQPVGFVGIRGGAASLGFSTYRIVISETEPNQNSALISAVQLNRALPKYLESAQLDLGLTKSSISTPVMNTLPAVTGRPSQIELLITAHYQAPPTWNPGILLDWIGTAVSIHLTSPGMNWSIEVRDEVLPVHNDRRLSSEILGSIVKIIGDGLLYEPEEQSIEDRFSAISHIVPGTLLRLGSRDKSTSDNDAKPAGRNGHNKQIIEAGAKLLGNVITSLS